MKTIQSNHKTILTLVLSTLIELAFAQSPPFVANTTNCCTGLEASVAYTQATSVAASTACGAACAASFIAINAAVFANITACNAAVARINDACQSSKDTCKVGAQAGKNVCAITKLYIQESTKDSNSQTFSACKAAMTGTTKCNAAYSTSYIACNVAHTSDYRACNKVLDAYVNICVTPGTSAITCQAVYVYVSGSCRNTAKVAWNTCLTQAEKAYKAC